MLQSRTTNVKTIPRLIFNATNTSRQTLKSCCKVGALMRETWAENRLFDFNLWAAGVGASAKSTASLDYRLESHPEGKTVVMGVLSSLQAALEECKELGKKRDLGLDVPYVSGSESVEPSDSDKDRNLDLIPSWSDNSDSDSSSDVSGTESAQDSLSVAMKSVEDLIDQLIRLGKTIRSSGAASRLRKADETFDPAANKDLQCYLTVLLFASPHVIENQRPSVEHIDGKNPFSTYDFAATDLLDLEHQRVVDHLISANLKRRNRFNYARKHAQKLAVNFDPEDPAQEMFPALHQNDFIKHKDALASPPVSDENQRVGHAATTDTTAASLIDPASKIPEPTQPSKFTMSRASVSLSRLNYPNPPLISNDTKTFICPCCFQTLSSMDHETDLWRKHVSQDILPYTCIFPDCPNGTCFYATRESWKQHIRQDHLGSTYWECLACSSSDTTETFPDVNQFRAHTKLSHGDTITDDQLATLERVCAKSSPTTIRSCPLCIYGDQNEFPMDPETLLNHIGDHIHDFSLLSLPWAESREEESSEIIAAATEKAMEWDVTLPLHLEAISLPLLEHRKPETPDLENHFAAKEYFAESSGKSSQAVCNSEQDLALSKDFPPTVDSPKTESVASVESSGGSSQATCSSDQYSTLPEDFPHTVDAPKTEIVPAVKSQRKDRGVEFYDRFLPSFTHPSKRNPKSNPDELPEENLRRRIQLFITKERIETKENKIVRIVEDEFVANAVAYFDFDFFDTEGPGASPFILINQTLLRDVELDGLYKEYDPENPPVSLMNPDGTKMKLLGEFSAKWSPQGPVEEYAGQQVFLNPNSFTTTRCVVLPEGSPHEVLIGLGTIKELKLDVPLPTTAAIEGQGEKRTPRPQLNIAAIGGQGGKHYPGPQLNIAAIGGQGGKHYPGAQLNIAAIGGQGGKRTPRPQLNISTREGQRDPRPRVNPITANKQKQRLNTEDKEAQVHEQRNIVRKGKEKAERE